MSSFFWFLCNRMKWGRWLNLRYYRFVLGVNQKNEEVRWVQHFIVLPQWFKSFHSDLSQAGWSDLVCVECLLMIKPMVVDFCSIGDWCYSAWRVWNLRTFVHFQVSGMTLAVFQVFKDMNIKLLVLYSVWYSSYDIVYEYDIVVMAMGF